MTAALVLAVAMLVAFATSIRAKCRTGSPPSPVSLALMVALVDAAALVLLVSFVRFRLADVEVVVTTVDVSPGHVLVETDLERRRVDRADAGQAITEVAEATGRIAHERLRTGAVVTTKNTPDRVALQLPASVVRANEPLAVGWVDVLATPRTSDAEPVVVEGALLQATANGGFVLQTTTVDRNALLAVFGRAQVIIQPRED
jgi:hypothetical protein